jgi:hypothetical protein
MVDIIAVLQCLVVSLLTIGAENGAFFELQSLQRSLRNLKKLCELSILGGKNPNNTREGDHQIT